MALRKLFHKNTSKKKLDLGNNDSNNNGNNNGTDEKEMPSASTDVIQSSKSMVQHADLPSQKSNKDDLGKEPQSMQKRQSAQNDVSSVAAQRKLNVPNGSGSNSNGGGSSSSSGGGSNNNKNKKGGAKNTMASTMMASNVTAQNIQRLMNMRQGMTDDKFS